jgi:hypothetical protein
VLTSDDSLAEVSQGYEAFATESANHPGHHAGREFIRRRESLKTSSVHLHTKPMDSADRAILSMRVLMSPTEILLDSLGFALQIGNTPSQNLEM